MVQNACYASCNADCLLEVNPIKSGQCFSNCSCKCNTLCREDCEDSDHPLACNLSCGCVPTEEDIIKKAKEEDAQEAAFEEALEATKASMVSKHEAKKEKKAVCTSDCVNSCLVAADTKIETIKCFTECGCSPATSNIELSMDPQVAPEAPQGSGAWGFLLFFLFLASVAGATAYLILDRKEKKHNRSDEEAQAALYDRLG